MARLQRNFILTLGRSGSSLLGAILSDSGADFGVSPPEAWDPRTGQMEDPSIKKAAHHYRRAYDIGEGRKYFLSPILETKYRLTLGRRYLREALERCAYLKIGDLDLVVQPAFKLGYQPQVILNFRQLEANLPSLLVGRTHVGPDQLAKEYVRIYRQGLLLLQTFGGCVVEYNELQSVEASDWARALAEVTALDVDALLASRANRLRGETDPELPPVYKEAFDIYLAMQAMRGEVVQPARQVERVLGAENG